jgi:hypothetical protein
MERRELLKMIATLTGTAFVGGELFLAGCKNASTDVAVKTFTPQSIAFLNEVAETILPTTSTPGAKAAKVGQFMTVMVNDCFTPEQQTVFHEGMQQLEQSFYKKIGTNFMKATPEKRTAFLKELDKEAKEQEKKQQEVKQPPEKKNSATHPPLPHYFTLMKQLTLLGYFTSKEGATTALRYLPVPGKYNGSIDYKKGDKAWATS